MRQTRLRKTVGMVDLDTSHAGLWIPILREMGYTISGVFDSGAVYPVGYAQHFANQHAIPHVFDDIEAMAASDDVEIVMVHSCNWDVHVGRVKPFVDAGKAILINKPIAGHLADLLQIRAWAQAGARISGGSSLRTCPEIQAQSAVEAEHGPAVALYAGCGVDEFYYGVHTYSMAVGLFGAGIAQVRHLGISKHDHHHVEMEWADGRHALLSMGGGAWLPFHASVVYKDTVKQFEANSDGISRVFLESLMPFLSGETDQQPFSPDALIEPELAALAARASLQQAGAWVQLADLNELSAGYEGEPFSQVYKAEALAQYVPAKP